MTGKTQPDPAPDPTPEETTALRDEVTALRAEVAALGDLLTEAVRAGQVAMAAAAPNRPAATFLSEGARLDAIEQEREARAGETPDRPGVFVEDTAVSAMLPSEPE